MQQLVHLYAEIVARIITTFFVTLFCAETAVVPLTPSPTLTGSRPLQTPKSCICLSTVPTEETTTSPDSDIEKSRAGHAELPEQSNQDVCETDKIASPPAKKVDSFVKISSGSLPFAYKVRREDKISKASESPGAAVRK